MLATIKCWSALVCAKKKAILGAVASAALAAACLIGYRRHVRTLSTLELDN